MRYLALACLPLAITLSACSQDGVQKWEYAEVYDRSYNGQNTVGWVYGNSLETYTAPNYAELAKEMSYPYIYSREDFPTENGFFNVLGAQGWEMTARHTTDGYTNSAGEYSSLTVFHFKRPVIK